MVQINWTDEVLKRKDELIQHTQELLQIKSVLDEDNATENAPLRSWCEGSIGIYATNG